MLAKYPYLYTDRMKAEQLNLELELSPGEFPPASLHGNARQYKQWIDNRDYPAVLRMCVVAEASPSYVPTEWATMATIDVNNRHVEWIGPAGAYLPIVGGTISGNLSVAGTLGVGGVTTVRDITAQNVNAQNVTAAATLYGALLDVTDVDTVNAVVQGNLETAALHVTTGGCVVDGDVQSGSLHTANAYVTNGLTTFNLGVTNLQTVNMTASNDVVVQRVLSVTRNVVVGAGLTTANLAATSFNTVDMTASRDAVVQRDLYVTGTEHIAGKLVMTGSVDATIDVSAGGITAGKLAIGGVGSFGGTADNTIWAPNGGVTAQRFIVGPLPSDFYLALSGPGKVLNFAPQCYYTWNATNRDMTYVDASLEFWQLQAVSRYSINKLGRVVGKGAYLDTTVLARDKAGVVDTSRGLDEVLALSPVSSDTDIGFIAEEVRGVFPEAVIDVSQETDDGPILGVSNAAIVAALVSAVKTINTRLAALEGAT